MGCLIYRYLRPNHTSCFVTWDRHHADSPISTHCIFLKLILLHCYRDILETVDCPALLCAGRKYCTFFSAHRPPPPLNVVVWAGHTTETRQCAVVSCGGTALEQLPNAVPPYLVLIYSQSWISLDYSAALYMNISSYPTGDLHFFTAMGVPTTRLMSSLVLEAFMYHNKFSGIKKKARFRV